uniref:Protein root UVB sensitive/RUS domain-containing protein n=1 Tax=Rhizochromulina marina TaxID=1034831 RepID=A0A7S2WMF6_9STRA|mmetsp:Transcript_27748/g.81139  ORF Transcript_27748/g.81139 Transcript_27748/m.81139 type:complete len:527 (+) Transcript_27748:18-1598(+)
MGRHPCRIAGALGLVICCCTALTAPVRVGLTPRIPCRAARAAFFRFPVSASAVPNVDRGEGVGGVDLGSIVENQGIVARRVVWDGQGNWVAQPLKKSSENQDGAAHPHEGSRGKRQLFKDLAQHTFVPEGVTADYYSFTRWRCFQRFVSATINVFGVQAMLLALGIKTQGALGAAAATSWVLKDALGKFGRIMWAGRMGRQFDSNAKRWRFRSSLLYAAGNGLEIVTYVFPASFLLIATSANCLKQISMLTSSATRNAIYRSFAAEKNNIGEISAKGEAQIAVVDLLGMMFGICLSHAVGTSRLSIGLTYLVLSCVDIFSIYQEIRSVVFHTLNFERTGIVLRKYIASNASVVVTPGEVARSERIFRRPVLPDSERFRLLSDILQPTRLTPAELAVHLDLFREEKFVVFLEDSTPAVIAHKEARSADVFKALFVCHLIEDALAKRGASAVTTNAERVSLIRAMYDRACRDLPQLLEDLRTAGWDNARWMFDVPARVRWTAPTTQLPGEGDVELQSGIRGQERLQRL